MTCFSFTCFILIFLDKPAALKTTQLEVIKQIGPEQNCTIFKFPASNNRRCQHSHNVYAYDASKKLFKTYENQLSPNTEFCGDKVLFEKIKFAKAVAVWMGETSDVMTEFSAVKSTVKGY